LKATVVTALAVDEDEDEAAAAAAVLLPGDIYKTISPTLISRKRSLS
jgi:hypothetical protein